MDNIFEVTMGRKSLRWDAVWRMTSWLLTPDEGHGCGSSILRPFSEFAFADEATECWSRCEYKLRHLHPQTSIGQWPDLLVAIPSREKAKFVAIMDDFALPPQRAREKIANLKTYYDLGRKEFPSAEVRVIVVTNTRDLARLKRSCETLDEGLPTTDYPDWWRPLPLGTIGDWVNTALSDHAPPTKSRPLLQDFVSWSHSLSP